MHTANAIDGVTIQESAAAAGRTGLTALSEARLRARLRRRSPSEPWVDAQFIDVSGADERGQPVVRRIHDPAVFPPGGPDTAMVRCPACGVFTPPQTIENGVCLDHDEHVNWGPSPSAAAIRAMEYRNRRLPECKLARASTAALTREIRRHIKRSSHSHQDRFIVNPHCK